jgi:hypothetical protein
MMGDQRRLGVNPPEAPPVLAARGQLGGRVSAVIAAAHDFALQLEVGHRAHRP